MKVKKKFRFPPLFHFPFFLFLASFFPCRMTDADPKKPAEDSKAAEAAEAAAPAPADAAAATLEGDDLFDEFGEKTKKMRIDGGRNHRSH